MTCVCAGFCWYWLLKTCHIATQWKLHKVLLIYIRKLYLHGYTVPLDLNLMLTSIYSRAPTPFLRAVSGCSRVSATCSREWFTRDAREYICSQALTHFQQAVSGGSRASATCSRAWFYMHSNLILMCITRRAFSRCLQASFNSRANSSCEYVYHFTNILNMIASLPLWDSIAGSSREISVWDSGIILQHVLKRPKVIESNILWRTLIYLARLKYKRFAVMAETSNARA